MKLWMKLTLIALVTALIFLSTGMLIVVNIVCDSVLQTAQRDCQNGLDALAAHMELINASHENQANEDFITRRALIAYYFQNTAGVLQNNQSRFSLWIDGICFFQTSKIHFADLFPAQAQVSEAYRLFQLDEGFAYLGCRKITVLGLPLVIYHASIATEPLNEISRITHAAQIVLACCLLLTALITPIMLRRGLQPLSKLAHMAENIAKGAYNARTSISGGDEVGQLSSAFDHMADTVQQKIETLENNAQKQELLLSALTHELKTPMTAIIGYADGCLTLPLSEDDKASAVKGILQAAKRVERLSSKMMQLITYRNRDVLSIQQLSVKKLLTQVMEETRVQCKQRHIHLHVHCEINTVLGDEDLLINLLTNLVDNACKASQDQTSISLTACKRHGVPCFEVRDQGCGIPPEAISLVFEPFYRVDKARDRKLGGAGLGLTLCRIIAESHGGSIELQSHVGIGTIVTVYLGRKDDTI